MSNATERILNVLVFLWPDPRNDAAGLFMVKGIISLLLLAGILSIVVPPTIFFFKWWFTFWNHLI